MELAKQLTGHKILTPPPPKKIILFFMLFRDITYLTG